jgi:hypothetical protein
MAVDGTYNVEIASPMGKQAGKLTLKAAGKALSGSYAGPRGEQAFSGGTVDGNNVAWSIQVSGPMGQMKLDFKGTVSGDKLSGKVQLGSFGSADFTGTRA